jgi:hypothetical protein
MTVLLRAALYLRLDGAAAEHDVSVPDQKRQGEACCQSRGHQEFARTARERIPIDSGAYCREPLRARAQRVADKEIRIMGSKADLLRTLAAASGAKSAMPGFSSFVPSWRMCLSAQSSVYLRRLPCF